MGAEVGFVGGGGARRKIQRRKTKIDYVPVPGHLLLEILLWLPPVSLLRSRCVRRSWRCTIDRILKDPMLMADYFKRSCTRPLFLFRAPGICPRRKVAECLSPICKAAFLASPVARFGSPFVKRFCDATTLSCDGIVCLYNVDRTSTIVVMNPALGRFVVLNGFSSWLPMTSIIIKRQLIGFGVDVVDKTYKVVRVVFLSGVNGSEIFTFGVKNGERKKFKPWRKIKMKADFAWCGSPLQDQQVSNNGVYYWLGGQARFETTENPILSFDLHSETFQCVPWPAFDEAPLEDHTRYSLLAWKERVVLLRYGRVGWAKIDPELAPNPIELWVLEEDRRGWSKLMTIPPLDDAYYPVTFLNQDDLILKSFSYSSEGDHFALYNIVAKKYTRLSGFAELQNEIYACRYVKSLYWIN